MTTQEFSDSFDTLVNSYATQFFSGEQASVRDVVLDEYEKSVFLTQAQEEIVINLYNGKNPYGDSFESTEEMRRYLDVLVKTKVYTEEDRTESIGIDSKSVFYKLPEDLAFITMEQVTYEDEELKCYNGTSVVVYPTTQDEFSKIKNNPFRGPTKYKALRIDAGDNIVEIISKYNIGEYLIKYLSRPHPIILEDLPSHLTINKESNRRECELNPILHNSILKRGVQLALQSKGININK